VVFNVGMDASMNSSVKPSAVTDDSSATVPNNAKRKRARDAVETVNVLQDFTLMQQGELPLALFRQRFKQYFVGRALDAIGEGSFRRFMLKHKNADAPWAVEMHRDTQYVQQMFRLAMRFVHQLQTHSLASKLHALCQRVASDARPPQVHTDGWALCALTGTCTERTVVLNGTSRSERVHVHRKFHKFFSMLWITAHVEAGVRAVVQHWLRGDTEGPQDYKSVAERFQADTELHERTAQCFVHSIVHVVISTHAHLHHITNGAPLIEAQKELQKEAQQESQKEKDGDACEINTCEHGQETATKGRAQKRVKRL
jgi:hypothetical protein